MSDINFGEIKVTPKHKQDGVWWGNAKEIASGIAIDTQPDAATQIGALYAGRKAIYIVQRGYSFADPTRDEPDLDLSHFVNEREVDGVLLRPQGIHAFRRHLSHGVGLFSADSDETPFGLVVPGRGTIVHQSRIDDFKRVAAEASLLEAPDKPINDIIASKAIGLSDEYARISKNSRQLILQ